MPAIFRYKGFRFFFFSNEGYPLEPVHVHVRNGIKIAKFWIEPEVGLAASYDMSPSELNEIEGIIREKRELIKEAWNAYFGDSSGS